MSADKAGNLSLHQAARAKKDEFYTRLEDITAELSHYTRHFQGKKVLCNCDDPYESNFFKYFALRFNALGLKKLTCTCYDGSPIAHSEQPYLPLEELTKPAKDRHAAYCLELDSMEDVTGDGAVDLDDARAILEAHPPKPLKGNGDFASEECLRLLDEADIVVTNPPFSLFRKYLATLVEHGKKFLIIGNQNAITYKDVFPLIKENKMWLGHGFSNGNAFFMTPHAKDYGEGVLMNNGLVKFRNCAWFTNLEHDKRHQPLDLYKRYSPEEFPRYDNYDAINVDKTSDIPMDYTGVMGVPITFLDKYCPEQFEVLGITENPNTIVGEDILSDIRRPGCAKYDRPYLNGKRGYARLLIRNLSPSSQG